jgi:hypothetical protein
MAGEYIERRRLPQRAAVPESVGRALDARRAHRRLGKPAPPGSPDIHWLTHCRRPRGPTEAMMITAARGTTPSTSYTPDPTPADVLPSVPRARDDAAERWLRETIGWYDAYARRQFHGYQLCRLTALLAAAAIPLVAAFGTGDRWRLWCAALGTLVTVLEGVQRFYRFHENWMASVEAKAALRREWRLYAVDAGPYRGLDSGSRRDQLALRVDRVISREQAQWTQAELRAHPEVDRVGATPLARMNGHEAAHDDVPLR